MAQVWAVLARCSVQVPDEVPVQWRSHWQCALKYARLALQAHSAQMLLWNLRNVTEYMQYENATTLLHCVRLMDHAGLHMLFAN